MTLSVIHTVAGIQESRGGTARSVPGLCDALSTSGVSVQLVTQRFIGQTEPNVLPTQPNVRTHFASAIHLPSLRSIIPINFLRALRRADSQDSPHLIHDHGLWLPCNILAAYFARSSGRPLVLHPRGSLANWSLSHRSRKKRVARRLFQDQILNQVAMFVATAEEEARDIRALGLRAPIAIIPNGIQGLPGGMVRKPSVRAERTLLFLSRIHPIKGLEMLVDAWATLQPIGWRCVIAGPDEEGTTSRLLEKIHGLGLARSFSFFGAADEAKKQHLFESADLFVLPSFSENFGIVVLESLAHGVPVITTTGTPWSFLDAKGIGWCVPPTAPNLVSAMSDAMAISDDARYRMGKAAQAFVLENYSWATVGAKMKTAYEWLLTRTEKPEFIHI